MNKMIYAPVLIPTLNRYEHLKQCLESLSRCTGADKTEVYVALDYPPADRWDKYAPGWEKNRDWLRSVGDMGFKKLHLIERTENYGIWNKKMNNLSALTKEVNKKYPYCIKTEDDNVFSPCFLEYINKGIEKFKDDESVLAISGYTCPYPIKYEENTYIRQSVDFSAWGCVIFRDHIPDQIDYKFFRRNLSFATCKRMLKYGRHRLAGYIRACDKSEGNISLIDVNLSMVGSLLQKDFIVPAEALVRNIGADGSGVNFRATAEEDPVSTMLINQKISDEQHFEFVGSGYEYYEENLKILRDYRWPGTISRKKLAEVILKSIAKRIIRG